MRKVFLDVGAHKGESTAAATTFDFDTIYAFEPSRASAEKIPRSDPRVTVLPFGLFSSSAAATLFHGKRSYSSSIYSDKNNVGASSEPIELRSASQWVKENIQPGDLAVMKINTEGAEVEILKDLDSSGAIKLLTVIVFYPDYRKVASLTDSGSVIDEIMRRNSHVKASKDVFDPALTDIAERTRTWLRTIPSLCPMAGREVEAGREDLIFDLGFHRGEDTAFYLAKGFRVVALEANPILAAAGGERFASFVEEGKLTIINAALSDSAESTLEFYINVRRSTWSSVDPRIAGRRGSEVQQVSVPTISLTTMFQRHGVPLYLKVDIEGADILAIEQLSRVSARPDYVSVELGPSELANRLADLGYTRFKLVNQALNPTIVLPNPALIGNYVSHRFEPGSSGAFGDEAPGQWKSLTELLEGLKALTRLRRREPQVLGAAWFDIHAAR